MGLTVKDRGAAVATFRFVNVQLMETLAQWTPSTPEMEVKLMFGEHIWDTAQAADALGKRAHELRLPLQHSLAPVEDYVALLAQVRAERDTARRLASMYDVLLPGLARRYREYIAATDVLMDEPTVRILEQALAAQDKMLSQCKALRAQAPALAAADVAWSQGLARHEAAIGGLVAAKVAA